MRSALVAAIIFILSAMFISMTMSDKLTFGQPQNSQMDDYFIENSQKQTATNNVVTAVVFDFRGFDTLGEATVLFVVVLAIGMVFRRLKEDEEGPHDQDHTIGS